MAVKCPNCRSADTTTSIGDLNHCLNCTANFDSTGAIVPNGPDATTRAVMEARLAPRQTNLSGNYADLQRLGGAKAADPAAEEFVLPAGVDPETIGDGTAAQVSNVTAAMSTTTASDGEVSDKTDAKQAEAAASQDAAQHSEGE